MTIASGTCGTNLTWVLNDDYSLNISGTGAMTEYYTLEDIPWYNYRSSITTVTLPEGITSIGANAFSRCPNLSVCNFPSSISSIGEYAFYQCGSLNSVFISVNGSLSISQHVFVDCSSLSKIKLKASGTIDIGKYAFGGTENPSITVEVTIISPTVHIDDDAFSHYSTLSSLTLYCETDIQIGSDAFEKCTSLTEIFLQRKPSSLGSKSFSLGTSSNPVTCVVTSPGNVANDAFKNTLFNNISGSYTTFSYVAGDMVWEMDVQGSGTQADPWTRWEGSAYQFWNAVNDGSTYYTKVGAVWDVTDAGDPSGYDYFIADITPTTYGLSIVNYDLVGTVTSAGIATVDITRDEGQDGETITINLIILGSEPTPEPSTVTVISAGHGTVSGGGVYDYNEAATVTATPDTGYTFDHWSDGAISSQYTFIVTSDVTLIAYFERAVNPAVDTPFSVIFDPSGGIFLPPSEYPSGLSLPSATVVGGDQVTANFDYDLLRGTWVWWVPDTATQAMKVVVRFSNIPLSTLGGLTPPSGIGRVSAWYIDAPYFQSEEDLSSDTQDFEVTLTRTTIDSMCQKTIYPVWVPVRDGSAQRALIAAPGYGAVDLGNIQSITETYSSKVIQTPIVIYGYTRSFCMDVGVQKEISIAYVRTMPKTVDDTNGDSRMWSNAKWIRKLKEAMNRWQMRTNGNRLYILRPRVTRDDDSEIDPMAPYINEIYGDNCYISSIPIRYDESPYTISGTITLSMGTLYPKQEELTPYTITYSRDNDTSQFVSQETGEVMSPKHPLSIWPAEAPEVVPIDGGWRIYGYTYEYWYVAGSPDTHIPFGKPINLSTIVPSGEHTLHLIAKTVRIDSDAGRVFIGGINTITFRFGQSGTMTIAYGIAGGGGGGGGGTRTRYDGLAVTGGGGGSSGLFTSTIRTFFGQENSTLTFRMECGSGGQGGGVYEAGSNGNPTSLILVDSNTPLDQVEGGGGGEQGSHTWADDESKVAYGGGDPRSEIEGSRGKGLARGGSGGQKNIPATAGLASPDGWGAGGSAGRYSDFLFKVCGGGGGGGGGRLLSSINTAGGNGAYGYNPQVDDARIPFTAAGTGGPSAGGGGGGGAYAGWVSDEYNDLNPGTGGNGGDGYGYIFVQSGGTVV